MTIPAEAIAEIAALVVRVVPEVAAGIMSALREDVREAVLVEVERNQAALDAAPSVVSRIDAFEAEARSRIRAHDQARAETVREQFALTDTMRAALRTVTEGREANHTEREDLRVLARFLDAGLTGQVDASPNDGAAVALRNVLALSHRIAKTDPENAAHLRRFCASAGIVPEVMR